MSLDNENSSDELNIPDELTTLKERADLMGIRYHPSISLEKLKEKINAHLQESASVTEAVSTAVAEPEVETEAQRRSRIKREANELVRIRVTCMNPAKREWDGEIFTAGNALVGSMRKYVPFNSDEGWHVPRAIYNLMVDRQCQVFTTIRDSRGNNVRRGKLIKEFAIEVLPQLTPAELKDLAQRQAIAKSID